MIARLNLLPKYTARLLCGLKANYRFGQRRTCAVCGEWSFWDEFPSTTYTLKDFNAVDGQFALVRGVIKDVPDVHGRYSVCERCLVALRKEELPAEAEANLCGFTLAPPDILMLTPMEEALIAPVTVMLRMVP